MKCLNCETEFEPKTKRAKFDSDKCRLEYFRNNNETQRLETESPETETNHTPTDQRFEDSQPGYYKFDDRVYSRTCLICQKKFKTRLQLLKTCSPEHYLEVLKRLSGEYSKGK